MPTIDPAARVHPDARLDTDVFVEMGAMVEAGVEIGAGSVIGPHAVLYSGTRLGEGVQISAGVVLGGAPQDLKFRGGVSGVTIGDRTVVREHVTVHRCVEPGKNTIVGADCLLMATSHVGHECVLGDRVVVTNGVMLAGHAAVGDGAILSGNVIVHQFTRIGRLAMISGGSAVRQDIVPFCLADGHPARPLGLNVVGLRRTGFTPHQIRELKLAYRTLFATDRTRDEALDEIEGSLFGGEPPTAVAALAAFVRASERGVARPRTAPRSR